jgi:cellulose synthase (UDP-forming)
MNLPEVSDEYNEILYDRIPTLPQSLFRDYGIVIHMLRNIAQRILR